MIDFDPEEVVKQVFGDQEPAAAPQPTAAAPQPTTAAPQPTTAAPQPTAAVPQPTAVAPQKTAAVPQKNAAAPQPTAAAPQKTAAVLSALASPGTPVASRTHNPGDTVKAGGKTYTVEKLLGSGTEGDIYVVNDRKRRYALKLCHAGFHPNRAVLTALQKLKGENVITEIIDFGDDFELMEYIPEGSASSAPIKGNAQAITAIALKMAIALDRMHKVGVLHKDVKPANILIRNSDNWDCVLCDFGIADLIDEEGLCKTTQVRTPIYAAPEVYKDVVTKEDGNYVELTAKADFYALGRTILSLWMGEGAFLSQKESHQALDKVKGRIGIPPDMPDPLAHICRGLLIKNPAKRWDLDEILRLLKKGEDVPVDEDEIVPDLNIPYNGSKNQIANTPKELAGFMAEDEDLAISYLYHKKVQNWLQPYLPELAQKIYDIVEDRFPKDRRMGLYAAIYTLDPLFPFPLSGFKKQDGEPINVEAVQLKDVSDFCYMANPDLETANAVDSDLFREWVRVRNGAAAAALPPPSTQISTFLNRIQIIDPLSDINLCNNPDDPDFAMTQEGLGHLLNKVYTIFWNICGGDVNKVASVWNAPEYAPQNRLIPVPTVICIALSFLAPEDCHYVTDFFDTKGQRFKQQRSWFVYCTDRNSDDYRSKSGPKDDVFRAQAAWMKVIKGFGVDPVYVFADSGETVTDCQELFKHSKKELRREYNDRGLRGWLAVQHQEDPHADLSEQFAYEVLLKDYLDDLGRIDDDLPPVQRFDEACDEADRIISEGRGRIHSMSIRSVVQYVLTIALAIVPAIILLAMLIFSIIENPIVDTGGLHLEKFFWPIGLIVAAIIFFASESEGCLIPMIGGALAAVAIFFVVKLLGAFILYIFAAIVLGVLVFFSIKTVFTISQYARDARRFNRPGFEEKVLEPLYYAFSQDDRFDSSLNVAFNDDDMDGWKDDLKRRRLFMLVFIGSVWALCAFSLLIPKSERFMKFSAPVIEKVMPAQVPVPALLDFESLKPGTRSEEVTALQEYLKEAGYLTGTVDGSYGRGTQTAVSEFQKANGLEPTGVADAETISAINRLHEDAVRAEEKARVKESRKARKESRSRKQAETETPENPETIEEVNP